MSEARSGYGRSVGGLFGALLAAFALIAVIWGLTQLQHRDVANPAKTVDYTATLAQAREQAPFDVLAPAPVPEGWRATTAQWSGAGPVVSWHLGFLTSESRDASYVGLEQGNAIARDFVAENTTADEPGSPVAIAGKRWDTLASSDGDETALVLEGDGVTTVVTGTAPQSELVAFAEALSAS